MSEKHRMIVRIEHEGYVVALFFKLEAPTFEAAAEKARQTFLAGMPGAEIGVVSAENVEEGIDKNEEAEHKKYSVVENGQIVFTSTLRAVYTWLHQRGRPAH